MIGDTGKLFISNCSSQVMSKMMRRWEILQTMITVFNLITRLCTKIFQSCSKTCKISHLIRAHLKERSARNCMKGVFIDAYAIFYLIFCIKAYAVGTHLLIWIDSISRVQKSTYNIFYKEVGKRIRAVVIWSLSTILLDCALIGVCAVIRSNTVCCNLKSVSTKHTGTATCWVVRAFDKLQRYSTRI